MAARSIEEHRNLYSAWTRFACVALVAGSLIMVELDLCLLVFTARLSFVYFRSSHSRRRPWLAPTTPKSHSVWWIERRRWGQSKWPKPEQSSLTRCPLLSPFGRVGAITPENDNFSESLPQNKLEREARLSFLTLGVRRCNPFCLTCAESIAHSRGSLWIYCHPNCMAHSFSAKSILLRS